MRRSSVEPWHRPGRICPATRNGARRATRCTPTRRSSASWPRSSRRPSRSCSTPRCASPRAGGRRRRSRRPTARARSSSPLDLHAHEAMVEHSDGRTRARGADPAPQRRRGHARAARRRRAPGRRRRDRPRAAGGRRGRSRSTRTTSTRPTTPAQVARYFAAATRVALVLAAFRAPYRGRSTPVNAWWGSFDLAVNLFSGRPADAAVRRLHHAQRDGRPGGRRRLVAGRRALRHGGLLRLRAPRARGLRRRDARARRRPLGRRSSASTCSTGTTSSPSPDPHAAALAFARSAFDHACVVCEWDPALAASAAGTPPPVV